MIGVLGQQPLPVIRRNGIRNFVEGYPADDRLKDEHLQAAQQVFFE